MYERHLLHMCRPLQPFVWFYLVVCLFVRSLHTHNATVLNILNNLESNISTTNVEISIYGTTSNNNNNSITYQLKLDHNYKKEIQYRMAKRLIIYSHSNKYLK